MQENILNAFAEQTKNLYSPMQKFSALFVGNMEKMTEFQLNAIKSYAEVGIDQMKKAAEVKDADSMRSFSSSQAEATTELNKKIMEDAKSLSEMATEFKGQVEAIMEEARGTASSAAAAATSTTKAKTTKAA
jgi:phasin family protein|tara:strand:- start:919 stop:1314 length:396 start_codon:yes stop_codon:yes gene_type:complete